MRRGSSFDMRAQSKRYYDSFIQDGLRAQDPERRNETQIIHSTSQLKCHSSMPFLPSPPQFLEFPFPFPFSISRFWPRSFDGRTQSRCYAAKSSQASISSSPPNVPPIRSPLPSQLCLPLQGHEHLVLPRTYTATILSLVDAWL